MKNWWYRFKKDQRGIGVVEIILILVILIALVILFRNQITDLVSKLIGQIANSGEDILKTSVTPQAPGVK